MKYYNIATFITNMKVCIGFVIITHFLFYNTKLYGAYRAYELRIICNGKISTITTSMPPRDYIAYHGGVAVVQSAQVLLSWYCPGNTSGFRGICQKPKMINPKFRIGDKVKVNIKNDPFNKMEGTIITGMYSHLLTENVYGVDLTNGLYVIFGEDAIQPISQVQP